VSDASTPEHHTLISYPDPVGDTQPFSERHSPSDGNRLLLSDKVQTTSPKSDDRPPSCPEAKCFVDLIHGQEGRQDLFSLKCGGCNRKLSWEVSDWLAAKIRSGALQGEHHGWTKEAYCSREGISREMHPPPWRVVLQKRPKCLEFFCGE